MTSKQEFGELSDRVAELAQQLEFAMSWIHQALLMVPYSLWPKDKLFRQHGQDMADEYHKEQPQLLKRNEDEATTG